MHVERTGRQESGRQGFGEGRKGERDYLEDLGADWTMV